MVIGIGHPWFWWCDGGEAVSCGDGSDLQVLMIDGGAVGFWRIWWIWFMAEAGRDLSTGLQV